MRTTLGLVLGTIALLAVPSYVQAHPGNTDSAGCHTCRTNCSNWGLSYGEYHCHNSKGLPQPEPPIRSHYGPGGTGTTEYWPSYSGGSSSYTAPSIPQCPLNSYYNGTQCQCNSGYVVDTDYSGNQSCVSGDSKCTDLMGFGARYNSSTKSCSCRSGYIQSGSRCVFDIPSTPITPVTESRSYLQQCRDAFGSISIWSGDLDSSYKPLCTCPTGYNWNTTQTACVALAPQQTTNPGSRLSNAQIEAIISLLQSFGADASVIANVGTSLTK